MLKQRRQAAVCWKGNRRKRALRAPARLSISQAEGHSLDRFQTTATSEKKTAPAPQTMAQFLKSLEDARDRNRRAWSLYNALIDTYKPLLELEALEEQSDAYARAQWREFDGGFAPEPNVPRPVRTRKSRIWKASRDVERLSACQSEFVAYQAKCCTQVRVVPVNCNHRLCPLCNYQRSEKYRQKVMKLFGDLENPQLLTLTVPSPRVMSSEVLKRLRTRVKAFLKQNNALLKGGVYSIEVTYTEGVGWHPHVHALVDVEGPAERLEYDTFRLRKWSLEFDWLVLTQGKNKRWRSSDFWRWMSQERPWERRAQSESGANCNRRVIDLRPVTKDRKAADEVLKYMSKAATFVGHPSKLRELLIAIRGVRQIQTFGTCYNVKLDDDLPAEKHLECECGKNDFKPYGRLGMAQVNLSPDGQWYIRKEAPLLAFNCRDGTNHGRRKQWH